MKLPLDPPKHLQNFRCASLRRGCFAPQRRPYPGRHYHPRHFRKRSRCPGRAGLPASAFRCTTFSLFEICASHPSRTHWKIGAARSPNFPVSFGRNRALDTQLRIQRRAVLANQTALLSHILSHYLPTCEPHDARRDRAERAYAQCAVSESAQARDHVGGCCARRCEETTCSRVEASQAATLTKPTPDGATSRPRWAAGAAAGLGRGARSAL